jgi:hypothetical protein
MHILEYLLYILKYLWHTHSQLNRDNNIWK